MKSRNASYLKKLRKERGYLLSTHEFLAANDPDFLEAYNGLFENLMTKEKMLPIKVKELIVIALLCSRGQYEAARLHVKRAMDHSATPRQILEAMETAMIYSGAPSLIYGADALIKHLTEIGKIDARSKRILS
jgi:alkylhydroperoxidase/carboxymuconolactone decarboxylase family protein YurZ